jgi:nucleotide-binding universal stress UspA family protein
MKILVAYDGMEWSRPALEETARVAKAEGGGHGFGGPIEVVVLSVAPPLEATPNPGSHMSVRPHAWDDVALAHAFLRERGIESEMKVAYGDAAVEIVREAQARRCDLIVVGSRGLGPVGRLLLGSVGRRVADLAPCPVAVASPGRVEWIEPLAATG